MKSARFELDGFFGEMVQEFKGETWRDVAFDFDRFQDLDCLLRQVYMMGTADDRGGVGPFEQFVYKWQRGEVAKIGYVKKVARALKVKVAIKEKSLM